MPQFIQANENAIDAVTESLSPIVIAFHTLNILAFVLIFVVLATAILAKNLHRLKAWYAFLLFQLFAAIAYSLHPFKTSDFKPEFGLCLVQAMLVHAALPSTNWALLTLVSEVYVQIRTNSTPYGVRFVLFSLPFVIFLGEALRVLISGLKNPVLIEMQSPSLFCHLRLSPFMTIIESFLYIVPVVLSTLLAISISFKAYQNMKSLRVERGANNLSFPLSILRVIVILFPPIPVVGCAFKQAAIQALSNLLPLVPILAAVAFVTQKDMISALFIWRR